MAFTENWSELMEQFDGYTLVNGKALSEATEADLEEEIATCRADVREYREAIKEAQRAANEYQNYERLARHVIKLKKSQANPMA